MEPIFITFRHTHPGMVSIYNEYANYKQSYNVLILLPVLPEDLKTYNKFESSLLITCLRFPHSTRWCIPCVATRSPWEFRGHGRKQVEDHIGHQDDVIVDNDDNCHYHCQSNTCR